MRAWEPHLAEVSSIVASLPPHGAVEGGAPFVEGQGMEGVINAEGDIETLKAYLYTSNLSTWNGHGERSLVSGWVGNLLFPAAAAVKRHARDS